RRPRGGRRAMILLPLAPSRLALWMAARLPRAGRAAVRLWARSYLARPRPQHWLFHKLKADLRVQLRERVPLLGGHALYVDPLDSIGQAIARGGCYEPETVEVFRRLVGPGAVVVDAGAHLGQYSVLGAAAVGPGGAVHAFEPDPVTFGRLRENLALNGATGVRCNNVALAREPGRATLYLADIDVSAGNSLARTRHYGGTETTVEVTTLDAYAAAADLRRLDLLKADVEGAELPLLEGGARTIERFRPRLILELSVHGAAFGYAAADLVARLEGWGYHVFRIGPLPLRPYTARADDPVHFNVLAVHASDLAGCAAAGVLEPAGAAPGAP
ncbi:MAG TPA: FkbM family methyltransferase, partial [Planctomycetota bacterium]|nr:FkbM family methyltransferase [Planctomycetota bacterium]